MKRVIRVVLFLIVFALLFNAMNEVFVEKSANRYYMLSKELEDTKKYDVLIFGSCHAYTSFNPIYFEAEYGIAAYNMANPSEIIPATYLRMSEQIKKRNPKVVLVETWGVNPYETYISSEDIMELYFPLNVENIPYSKEKKEVIDDFETLDYWADNFAVFKYKSRLVEGTLSEIDFDYSFEKAKENYEGETTGWMYAEMENRFAHNGFLAKIAGNVEDYEQRQNEVPEDDILAIETDIMKYVKKIIALCKEYDVKLMFYRAPYVSTENELRKVNYLEQYLVEQGITFYDMEDEIEYNYTEDFNDYEHLSETGAQKTTEFLGEKIIQIID